MRVRRVDDVVSVCTAAALLAGCDGSQSPVGALGAMQGRAIATSADHGGSWMSTEAKAQDLLYVDAGGEVYVLTFPALKLVGTLSSFYESTGVCSDTQGNVWVANDFQSSLVEYAHGGTTPIATLDDPNQYPFACSFDPKTGDLAVTDIPVAGGSPSIAVYPHETGSPVVYSDQSLAELFYLSYGPRSELFFDGTTGNDVEMGRFRNGTFLHMKAPKIAYPPGGVQYADAAVTTDAQGNSGAVLIYRMTDAGVVKSTTTLLGAYTCQAYLIWKDVLICPSGYADVREYRYPQGGNYIKKAAYSGIQVTMSAAQR